jgi:hypothetical protein
VGSPDAVEQVLRRLDLDGDGSVKLAEILNAHLDLEPGLRAPLADVLDAVQTELRPGVAGELVGAQRGARRADLVGDPLAELLSHDGLCERTRQLVTHESAAQGMCAFLRAAEEAEEHGNHERAVRFMRIYVRLVQGLVDKALTHRAALTLTALAAPLGGGD